MRKSRINSSMALRSEFDLVNKDLLLQFEAQLTDESVTFTWRFESIGLEPRIRSSVATLESETSK